MKRRRASLDPDALDDVLGGGALPVEASHYFTRVLRLAAGTAVEVADGAGRIATGHLVRSGRDWLLERITLAREEPDTVPIVLCAGLLKPKRWSLVIEKSVELGVARVVPVLTERGAVRPRKPEVDDLVQRWSRVALEALKQCRRITATRVDAPRELAELLAEPGGTNRLLADPDAAGGWPDGQGLVAEAETHLLIGPEGGLTDGEREAAAAAGFAPISLGAYALRAETAAIALVAMARDRLGFARAEVEGRRCP